MQSIKKLNLLDATLIVSGSMIGSGIFIVASQMSREVGSAGWLLFAWIFTGVITLFAALCYGELASMMPKAGGQYVYIQRAFGKLPAFVYGWSVFSVIQTGVLAAVAVAFGKHIGVFFPDLGENSIIASLKITNNYTFQINAAQLVAVCMIVLLTYINSLGVREGKWVQRIFTFAKLFALAALIMMGISHIGSDTWNANFTNPWQAFAIPDKIDGHVNTNWIPIGGFALVVGLGAAMIGSLFSSDAWNCVTFIAGEIEKPEKNVQRSLLLGTLIVTVIYCLANVAYLALLPLKGSSVVIAGAGIDKTIAAQGISHAINGRVGAAASSVLFGNIGYLIMAGLIVISTFGCNNGLILAGGRLYSTMANDGMFFKAAGQMNKNNVPATALWIQAAWGSVLCLSGSYGQLLEYCTFASLLFYIITVMSMMKLRKTEPNTPRPYKVKLYPLLPLAYIILASAIGIILLYAKWQTTLLGLGIVLLAIPIYYGVGRKKEL